MGRDYRNRWVTVDDAGIVRVHDNGRVRTLDSKRECAGTAKKVVHFNSKGEQFFYISAHDRSIIFEVDLTSVEEKVIEHRFQHTKIIDFLMISDTEIATLSKDGWFQTRDITNKSSHVILDQNSPLLRDKRSHLFSLEVPEKSTKTAAPGPIQPKPVPANPTAPGGTQPKPTAPADPNKPSNSSAVTTSTKQLQSSGLWASPPAKDKVHRLQHCRNPIIQPTSTNSPRCVAPKTSLWLSAASTRRWYLAKAKRIRCSTQSCCLTTKSGSKVLTASRSKLTPASAISSMLILK